MYNLLVASAAAALTFAIVAVALNPWAAIVPAVLVWVIAIFLLARRVGRIVEQEMQKVEPLLRAHQVEEAKGVLEGIKARWGRWQPMLAGSIDAQVGMLDYYQMKWDAALPRLEAGRFRNWTAQVALGCIHHRKGNKDKAWAELQSATETAPKELVVYLVYANLLLRSNERNKALEVIGKGLENLPKNELLDQLQVDVANKRKVKTDRYPETWYNFFPEDLLKSHLVKGRRGVQPMMPQPRFGARMAPRR